MRYTVRVNHDSQDPDLVKSEDFTEELNDQDKLNKCEADARAAYKAALEKYDPLHTVYLFRDNTALDSRLGTGTGTLKDEQKKDDGKRRTAAKSE